MKASDNTRATKRAFFTDARGIALVSLIHGVLVIPPFILIENLWVKAGLYALYFALLFFQSRRINFLSHGIVFLTIVLVNLFVPEGRVVLKLWDLPVTSGAFVSGAEKGLNVLGLLVISQFSIRRGLEFPGAFGRILTKTSGFLESFLEEKKRLPFGGGLSRFSEAVDELLVGIWKKSTDEKPVPPLRSAPSYLIVVSILIIINWLFLFAMRMP
jgi:hypothetical protein